MQKNNGNNVLLLDNSQVSNAIITLVDLYDKGSIEGLVMGIKLKTGEFYTMSTDKISFLEKLGLTQAISSDVCALANEVIE